MAYLGSASVHRKCSGNAISNLDIKRYLEQNDRGDRALARHFINIAHDKHDTWDLEMDRTRALCGNDTKWGGKDAVMYRHFVISCDPKDNVSLETLTDLALEWAYEFFGDNEGNAGRYGSYEVALIPHDDNASGILHYHVIVNNTDLETGKRLQIPSTQLLTDRLQDMAKERGLRYFDEKNPDPLKDRKSFFTKAERSILKAGKFSWKQEIRNSVLVAQRLSNDENSFIKRLEMQNISVEKKINLDSGKEDYFYTLRDNPRWRSSGYRLGPNYTMQAFENSLEHPVDPTYAKNIDNYLSRIGQVETIQTEYTMSIKDVAEVLRVNDRYGITSMKDYDKVLKTLAIKIDRAKVSKSENLSQYRESYAKVADAKKLANSGSFFKDVKPNHKIRKGSDDGNSGGWSPAGNAEKSIQHNRTRNVNQPSTSDNIR